MKLPDRIKSRLNKMTVVQDDIGCSTSKVFNFTQGSESLYLKISPVDEEALRERDIMSWVKHQLKVPAIMDATIEEGQLFLLMEKVKGEMLARIEDPLSC